MFINFFCSCGKKLKAPVNAAGKRGRCPGCGAGFLVPQTSSVAPISTSSRPQGVSVPKQAPPPPAVVAQKISRNVPTAPTSRKGLPKTADGRPPKCTVCEYRVEQIEYSKTAILYCETCPFYVADYETMLYIINNPEVAPDPKLAVKLKILFESRLTAQKGEASSKKCYYCQSPLMCAHYRRVPSLLVEQCPKGCMVLVALSNFKKMQALEKMGITWAPDEAPFPKLGR